MKLQKKIKIKSKSRAYAKSVKSSVTGVFCKHKVLRHFRLISHNHTGKLLHHRHTSHLALVGILVFLGFFLLANQSVVRAEDSSSSVLVGVIVTGPAPAIGATILSPVNGETFTSEGKIKISGSCEKNSFVIIRDNELTVGSTYCTDAGVFDLNIQLHTGKNILSALNYDNLNQVGPVTSTVEVILASGNVSNGAEEEYVSSNLPINPSVVPGAISDISDCSSYGVSKLPVSIEPHITVVCVPRLFMPNVQHLMGIIVWGGTPPYAVSVDFGADGSDDNLLTSKDSLLSLSAPGYKTLTIGYAVPSTYKIAFKVKDGSEKTAMVETAVQVSGSVANSTLASVASVIGTEWFTSPVPFYLLAVAITLGFWGGDIFDRKFGVHKKSGQRRKSA